MVKKPVKKTKKARPKKKSTSSRKSSGRQTISSFAWSFPPRFSSSPQKRTSLRNRSLFKSPSKRQKAQAFLEKNAKFIPHAVGAAGLAYVLAKAYKTDPVYFKLAQFSVLNGVDVFGELNIPRSSTTAEVKEIIRKCLLTSHPDKNRGVQGRHFSLCEELYKVI